jgi:hypothetical protein
VRVTLLAIAAFALVVAAVLLGAGPFLMRHVLFGQHHSYPGGGLALVGLGMGMHLAAGALNQSALARDQARAAAACWLLAAALFVGWMLAPVLADQLLRAESGYAGATALLALALALVYRGRRWQRPSYSAPIDSAIAR